MDTGNWFGFFLLAGVFLSDSAGAACTTAAATSCLANITQSDAVAKLQAFDQFTTTTALRTNCDAAEEAIACLKRNAKDCTDSQRTQVMAMVPQLETIFKSFCNKAMTCMAKRNTCFVADPSLNSYLATVPMDFDTSFCPAMLTLASCLKQNMPHKCHLVNMVQVGTHRLHLAENFCQEQKCPELQTCRQTFDNSSPVILDSKTCTLYSNYVGCVGGAAEACSSIASPQREPSVTVVSQLVAEACSLISSEGSGLYNCESFTTCLNTFFSKQDSFSPQQLCRSFQGVLGCAMTSAAACGVDAGSFAVDGNKLALKASAMGCGAPSVHTAGCPQLMTCKFKLMPLAAPGPSFGTVCQAVLDFQTCAYTAANTCGLVEPSTTPPRPRLDKMADITRYTCNAMQGNEVTTCREYLECTGGPKVDRPMTEGELITGDSWCPSSVYTVACALFFSEECAVSEELKIKLNIAYKRLLDEGCENIFNAKPEVDGGTAGAQWLVPASLMSLLFLAVSPKMVRLV